MSKHCFYENSKEYNLWKTMIKMKFRIANNFTLYRVELTNYDTLRPLSEKQTSMFKKSYTIDYIPDVEEIVKDEMDWIEIGPAYWGCGRIVVGFLCHLAKIQ